MKIRPFCPFAHGICEQQYRNFLTSSLLGRNQLIVWFASPATSPNFELKNPTFWDGKMKFRQLPTCGSYKRTDTFFFHANPS